jgi:hypothetical protein
MSLVSDLRQILSGFLVAGHGDPRGQSRLESVGDVTSEIVRCHHWTMSEIDGFLTTKHGDIRSDITLINHG